MTDFAAGLVYQESPPVPGSIVRIANLVGAAALVASSGVNIAIPAATKLVYVKIRGTGGMTAGFSTGVLARLNGDAGANYAWSYADNANMVAAPAFTAASSATTPFDTAMLLAVTASAPATDISIAAEIDIAVVTGAARGFRSEFGSRGAAAASSLTVDVGGWWTNTASTVTTLNLIFGSAFTGTVTVDAEF